MVCIFKFDSLFILTHRAINHIVAERERDCERLKTQKIKLFPHQREIQSNKDEKKVRKTRSKLFFFYSNLLTTLVFVIHFTVGVFCRVASFV